MTRSSSKPHPKKFIFTITPGRTGTQYLAQLFSQNFSPHIEAHHEILYYTQFGYNIPDISHLARFNSLGNVKHVRQFWHQKLNRIRQTPHPIYIETSHLLAKAGLIENLQHLLSSGEIHLIILHRDLYLTHISHRTRYAFTDIGAVLLWYLDPNYPKNIISFQQFPSLDSPIDSALLWYICEVYTRAHYYQIILKQTPNIFFHHVNINHLNQTQGVNQLFSQIGLTPPKFPIIPPVQNQHSADMTLTKSQLKSIKHAIDQLNFNPHQLAINYLKNGHSLG